MAEVLEQYKQQLFYIYSHSLTYCMLYLLYLICINLPFCRLLCCSKIFQYAFVVSNHFGPFIMLTTL